MQHASRGQEEAPIELLIAVALLTFVVIIGIYTYQNFCGADFEQKMKTSLNVLRGDLELVYRGAVGSSQSSSADFSPAGCAGSASSVYFFKGTEEICRAQLGVDDCVLLAVTTLISAQEKHAPVILAVNIPSDVTIRYEKTNSLGCDYARRYDEFLSGSYQSDADFGCEPFSLTSHAFMITKTASKEIKIRE